MKICPVCLSCAATTSPKFCSMGREGGCCPVRPQLDPPLCQCACAIHIFLRSQSCINSVSKIRRVMFKFKLKFKQLIRVMLCHNNKFNNNKKIVKMADVVRLLLLSLTVIVLISFATCDILVQNMNCEMACALNYSQVSFSNVIFYLSIAFCYAPAVTSFVLRFDTIPVTTGCCEKGDNMHLYQF